MTAWTRSVGEGPGFFLGRISGSDQEEVTLRAAAGGVGVGAEEVRVDTGEKSGREGGE